MTADARSPRRAPLLLLAGPALFAAAVALGFVSNALVQIGPLDGAAFGWAIVVPMLLAAPVVAGLAGRRLAPGPVRNAVVGGSIVVGIGAVVLFALTTDHVGCSGPLSPIERVRAAVPVGVAAACAYGLPGWVALRMRARAAIASVTALAAGIAAWIAVLFAIVLAYGVGATCAFVPS